MTGRYEDAVNIYPEFLHADLGLAAAVGSWGRESEAEAEAKEKGGTLFSISLSHRPNVYSIHEVRRENLWRRDGLDFKEKVGFQLNK